MLFRKKIERSCSALGCRPDLLGDFIPKPLLRFARF